MSDPDRERIVVEETPPRVERETTVISTGDGGGGGGTIVALLLVLVVAVLLFLYLSGNLGGAADEVNLNVDVETPKIEAPDIDINVPPPGETSNKSGD